MERVENSKDVIEIFSFAVLATLNMMQLQKLGMKRQ